MTVELADEQDDPLEPGSLRSLAQLVLREEGLTEEATVSILFVDPEEMARLNEEHLDRSGPTDVLSFPLEDLSPGNLPSADPEGPPPALGDVVICPRVVRDRAVDTEVAFEDEMALMVVHGLLHLLGYDHEDDDDAELMEGRERELLGIVGRVRR